MDKTWSVTEITLAVKGTLESAFPRIRVEGEISNFRPSGAGHQYFTLKDETAVLSAAFFRGRASSCPIKPANGMKVVAQGRIDVYPPRGSYQLIVETLEEAGRGSLLEMLERRKNALAEEGLFDQNRKRPLPAYPRRVAVVTSPTGAAIRDILRVLGRRSAAPHVTVLPCLVQGADAAEQIAARLRQVGPLDIADVVIVARGGGSVEDLLPFSEESVVRAVAECPIPVISGVGHEIDVSLADLAADIRAATPSSAAELVSDRSEDLLLRCRGFLKDSGFAMSSRIATARARGSSHSPVHLARILGSRFDDAHRMVDDRVRNVATVTRERLQELSSRREKALLTLREASPQKVMERGYARVSFRGKTVTSTEQLKVDDDVSIDFAQGRAGAKIMNIEDQS